MSAIYLKVTIAHIRDPERQQDVSFLVDLGPTRAWTPADIVEGLGIERAGDVRLELADGGVTDRPYGFCFFV